MGKVMVNLPDEMEQFVARRTRERQFSDEAEYIRSLIRRDQYGAYAWDGSDEHLLALIADGEGGPSNEMTPAFVEQLRARTRAAIASSDDHRPRRAE
jgi:Arc/MetJ-type ribon-helix-helix transcriptional regulator